MYIIEVILNLMMNYSIYVCFWFIFFIYLFLCCIVVDIKFIWYYLLNFILYFFEKEILCWWSYVI